METSSLLGSEPRRRRAGDGRAERLAAMVAHELKNPLASVLANLGAALEMTSGDDPRRPFLAHAETDLLRVRDLLRACLDLGRSARIAPALTRLDTLMAEFARRRQAAAAPAAVTLTFVQHHGAALWAQVDPLLCERLLDNLVDNALSALAPALARGQRGRITLALARADGGVVLAVEDDGPGVPEPLQRRIFAPFVTSGAGSGLGLFFVRQVAEAHGGRATLERSPMGGARFVVQLPQGGGEGRG